MEISQSFQKSTRLEFSAYCDRILMALKIPTSESYDGSTSLYDELGLDSFDAFELLVFTEELAGLDEPLPELPQLFTLGDAFSYYVACRNQALASEAHG